MNRVLVWAPLVVIAALVGVFAFALLSPRTVDNDPFQGQPLPALPITQFGDDAGFDLQSVDGPYLLNIWASWCTPCLIEHPYLMDMARSGVPIYGIVYKDDPADAQAFLNRLGNPFTGLMADREGRAGIELGMTGAPETLLIDDQGKVQARWRGALTDIVWQQSFAEIWAEAGGEPVVFSPAD